jgi:hypothetical protein
MLVNTFVQYLHTHQIEPLQLSVLAGVRYVTVWNAVKGNPITAEHAEKIRQALKQLTGRPYIGIILTFKEPPGNTLPSLPIRKLPAR